MSAMPGCGCIIAWSLFGSGLLLHSGCSSSKQPDPIYPEVTDSQAIIQSALTAPVIYYIVKPGNTLYSIAWLYESDYRQIAAINAITDPDTIYPGQRIVISSATAFAKPKQQSDSGATALPTVVGGQSRQPSQSSENANPGTATKTDNRDLTPALPLDGESPAVDGPATIQADQKLSPVNQKSDQQPRSAPGQGLRWTWPASGGKITGYGSGNKGINIAGKPGQPIKATADGKVVYSGSGLSGYGKLIILKHNEQFLSAYAHNQRVRVKEGQIVRGGQHIADMGQTGTNRVMLHFEIRKAGKPVNPERYLPPG